MEKEADVPSHCRAELLGAYKAGLLGCRLCASTPLPQAGLHISIPFHTEQGSSMRPLCCPSLALMWGGITLLLLHNSFDFYLQRTHLLTLLRNKVQLIS